MDFLSELVYARGPWDYFEKAIARFLVHKGWDNVELVGGTGDKGADIIATNREVEYVFQVKYSGISRSLSSNVKIVEDVIRAMEFYEIDKGICISNRNLNEAQSKKLQTYKDSGFDVKSYTGAKLLTDFEKMDPWIKDIREPHNYQIECIRELKAVYPRNRKGLIALATGMGKTFVACSFIKWLYENNRNLNILVLAHTEPLLEQFEKSLWESLPKSVTTSILSGSSKPIFTEGVLLSTFGSLENWYKKNDDLNFDVVIVDEAHHSRAPTYERAINKIKPNFLLGLTATPFRSDGASVTDMFGPPLVYYDVRRGIENQFLKEVSYKLRVDNIDRNWIIENSRKGYTIKQLNRKLFIPERDEELCDLFVQYWRTENRKRGIIFCQSIEHAKAIQNIMREVYNLPCFALTNDNDKKENAKRLRDFRKGDIKVLTAFDMLNEGIDVPDVDVIAFLRVTHSRTYFLQQLGRGLRYKRNEILLVLDFVSDIRRIAAVRNFQRVNISSDGSKEILQLPSGFNLEFTNDNSQDFLELVTQDVETEFLEEHDLVTVN